MEARFGALLAEAVPAVAFEVLPVSVAQAGVEAVAVASAFLVFPLFDKAEDSAAAEAFAVVSAHAVVSPAVVAAVEVPVAAAEHSETNSAFSTGGFLCQDRYGQVGPDLPQDFCQVGLQACCFLLMVCFLVCQQYFPHQHSLHLLSKVSKACCLLKDSHCPDSGCQFGLHQEFYLHLYLHFSKDGQHLHCCHHLWYSLHPLELSFLALVQYLLLPLMVLGCKYSVHYL